jgi:hypothetical protein
MSLERCIFKNIIYNPEEILNHYFGIASQPVYVFLWGITLLRDGY